MRMFDRIRSEGGKSRSTDNDAFEDAKCKGSTYFYLQGEKATNPE
jgi:hypothetical protein